MVTLRSLETRYDVVNAIFELSLFLYDIKENYYRIKNEPWEEVNLKLTNQYLYDINRGLLEDLEINTHGIKNELSPLINEVYTRELYYRWLNLFARHYDKYLTSKNLMKLCNKRTELYILIEDIKNNTK